MYYLDKFNKLEHKEAYTIHLHIHMSNLISPHHPISPKRIPRYHQNRPYPITLHDSTLQYILKFFLTYRHNRTINFKYETCIKFTTKLTYSHLTMYYLTTRDISQISFSHCKNPEN